MCQGCWGVCWGRWPGGGVSELPWNRLTIQTLMRLNCIRVRVWALDTGSSSMDGHEAMSRDLVPVWDTGSSSMDGHEVVSW